MKELFFKLVKEVEREKLTYFALVYKQSTLTIIAPADNAEQKKFLGYDWSNRKGAEGIQINQPGGMLYNDSNRYDNDTLAAAVRNSFNDITISLPDTLEKYHAYLRTQDMLDFSRTTFNKAIKLTADKKIEIVSKYPLVLFSSIVSTLETGSRPSGGVGLITEGALSLGGEHIDNSSGYLNLSTPKYVSLDFYNSASRGKLKKGDLLICKDGALTGKVAMVRNELEGKAAMINEHVFIVRCKDFITQYYLFELLYSAIGQSLLKANITGSAQGGLNSTNLKAIKIPVPPIDIQQKIVSECEKVDEEYNNSRMSIEEYKKKIAEVFERLEVISKMGGVTCRLSNSYIFDISIGRRILNTEVNPNYDIPVYSANVFEPFGMVDKLLIEDFSKESVLWGIDGDWMVNVIPANKPFYPTDHCGVLRIKTDDILPKYMAHLLEEEGKKVGFKRSYRASIDRIESLSVKVAPIEEQRKAVSEIESYEAEIAKAKAVMAGCAERKKQILEKWLR